MNVIRPNCRIQFTAEDIDFIVSVLGKDYGEATCLVELLSDDDTRDVILDHDRLFRAILERSSYLEVSTRLYFYILVRHVLLEAGIKEPEIADYVAEVLSVIASAHRTRYPLPNQASPMNYVVDMLAAMQSASHEQRFLIRAHLGNFTLFLVGLFPGYIRERRQRRGSPSLEYYERVGQTSYRVAGNHNLAEQYELGPVFHSLSDRFHSARLALNDLSDRLVSLEDARLDPRLLLDEP